MRKMIQNLLCMFCGIGMLGCVLIAIVYRPNPHEIRVVPPAADLAPALARFSGPWIFPNAPHRQLVVQSINETWALILQREPEGNWTRIAASVRRDGTVRWGAPDRYALRWVETGAVLDHEGAQGSGRIALQRLSGMATDGLVFLDTRTDGLALD